jgi:tripartite-type tricarboxylate transporter receptor subunit TctC
MKVAAAGIAAMLLSCLAPAYAQDYPTKPIKIVVPYAAGGSTDALARLVAERMGPRLGQTAIVENKPGASEQIAITGVTKAAPDGYTINPTKDLSPILLAATVPSVVVVHPSVPVKSMSELAAYLKSKLGAVSYSSAGNGTPSHLAMEYYNRQNGFDPVHVPYKGGAPALQELMGGQVSLMMALVPEAMPLVKSGRLRALAVTTTKRLAARPDLPTVAESGGKDFDMTFWYAFMAPANTPPAIVTRLNEAIDTILREKDVVVRLSETSLDVVGGAPAKVTDIITSDSARWKKVIDEAGIKVD